MAIIKAIETILFIIATLIAMGMLFFLIVKSEGGMFVSSRDKQRCEFMVKYKMYYPKDQDRCNQILGAR